MRRTSARLSNKKVTNQIQFQSIYIYISGKVPKLIDFRREDSGPPEDRLLQQNEATADRNFQNELLALQRISDTTASFKTRKNRVPQNIYESSGLTDAEDVDKDMLCMNGRADVGKTTDETASPAASESSCKTVETPTNKSPPEQTCQHAQTLSQTIPQLTNTCQHAQPNHTI